MECVFLHRLHSGHLVSSIERRGHEVITLESPEVDTALADPADYEAWLGVSMERDAAECGRMLARRRIDWLVVDHYGLGLKWEQAMKEHVKRLLVIDDLANRAHAADILVDQNYWPDPHARYRDLVPPRARCLMGPRFAIMGPEYHQARLDVRPREGVPHRVLVYYGGSDLSGETLRAIRVLGTAEFARVHVDVVIGANSPHTQAIRELAADRPGTIVHGPSDTLVDLTKAVDLALGAGGSSTWERCTLGLPCIATAIAPNQVELSRTLHDEGLTYFLGIAHQVSDGDLIAALRSFSSDPSRLKRMSERVMDLTDGLGANRVADEVLPIGDARREGKLIPAEIPKVRGAS
jgi:UDP-2,4-diacetamido-2,4,6-trideoxy-beta-L-altropyranose hydrolase